MILNPSESPLDDLKTAFALNKWFLNGDWEEMCF